jgi:hypothetical protein
VAALPEEESIARCLGAGGDHAMEGASDSHPTPLFENAVSMNEPCQGTQIISSRWAHQAP